MILGFNDVDVSRDEFVDKPPHNDEVIDHGNGVVQKFENGDESWYKNGVLHRDDDLLAAIYHDGTRYFYNHRHFIHI
jgi:hypothetical protein